MSLEEQIAALAGEIENLASAIAAQTPGNVVVDVGVPDRRYIMKSLHPSWNPDVHYLIDGNRVRVLSSEEGDYLHNDQHLPIIQTSAEEACRALYWEAIAIQGFVYSDTKPR